MFDDVSSVTLRTALDGLALRQRVIADNISNIETPGYLAKKVKFEEALGAAVSSGGSPADVTPTVARSLEPTRLNGNNVMSDEVDPSDVYQLALRAMDAKFGLLHDVIKG